MQATIALLPGDGIGPEVTGAAERVLRAVADRFGHTFTLTSHLIGGAALHDGQPPLPDDTREACQAADAVLVPLQCEFFALEGISHLVKTIDRIKQAFNPGLEIQGIVLTMFDRRNNLSGMVADDVRDFFGDKVYQTVIPRNVRVSEAPSHGKPALVYDMKCAGSQAYLHLAGEVLRRERGITA